jgi:hypothetical protein
MAGSALVGGAFGSSANVAISSSSVASSDAFASDANTPSRIGTRANGWAKVNGRSAWKRSASAPNPSSPSRRNRKASTWRNSRSVLSISVS